MIKPIYTKHAQFLNYVQVGMVTFSYVALIAAVVVMLTGGRSSEILSLSALGSGFGLGSVIVGRFVKRALEANPLVQISRIYQQALLRSKSLPPPLVAVTIRPVAGQDYRYELNIHNGSPDTLTNGSLDLRWLLHPGKFGLDDTHMPNDIWVPAPIQFDTLAPGEEITWEVDGYDVASKYDGPKETRVIVKAKRGGNEGALASSENLTASVRMAW